MTSPPVLYEEYGEYNRLSHASPDISIPAMSISITMRYDEAEGRWIQVHDNSPEQQVQAEG